MGLQVVGVVRDARQGIGWEKPGPGIYFSMRPGDYAQPSLNGTTLLVRGAPGAGDILDAVRLEIAAMDSRITPFHARTMTRQIDEAIAVLRLAPWIYGSIGFFGLILSAVGLAGVTAYSVARRTREIGIRVALGARRGDVLALVMKEGPGLVALGTALGLVLSQVVTRILAAFLSAVSSTATRTTSDPLLLVGAPLLLAILALGACYAPARRTTRVNPIAALRHE